MTNLKKSIANPCPTVDMTVTPRWTVAHILKAKAAGALTPPNVVKAARRLRTYKREQGLAYVFLGYLDGATLWQASDGVLWTVLSRFRPPYFDRMTCEECGAPATQYVGGWFGCDGCLPF